MGLKRTDEFRKDAVRIAPTSGLTRLLLACATRFNLAVPHQRRAVLDRRMFGIEFERHPSFRGPFACHFTSASLSTNEPLNAVRSAA